MPAAKKHPTVRRRNNRASTAAVLNANGSATIAPRLPQLQDGEGASIDWHPQAIAWWADLWASPMSAEYHASDVHSLFILARLWHDYWRTGDKLIAAEIRLQSQRFGITPYDRRRLEWTIEEAETAKRRGQVRRAGSPQPNAATDPRNVLRSTK